MDVFTSGIAIAAIIFGTGLPIILVGMILWFKARRQRMLQDLAIALAEKGQPLPPELFFPPRTTALRSGLVLVGVGIALCLFLWQVSAPWSLGLIPLFAGLGYLISWKIEAGTGNDHP